MSLSKRHHYTPRYYLKRFENEEGAMWRRDEGTGEIVRGNNTHFGYMKHWNTQQNPPDGMPLDWAEKQLAEIDGLASTVIARIVSGSLPSDIRALASAISFMKNNQPSLKRHLEENNAQEVADWLDDHWLLARIKASIEDWEKYIPVHYSVQVIDEKEHDVRFLTASNPLIEMEKQPIKLLPVSSRHCLTLMYDRQYEGCAPFETKCNREIVAGINRLMLKNSWQYVYSCKPDFSE